MRKLLQILIAACVLTGCATAKYSIVAGEYGWDKQGENGAVGSKYSSETMYKVNTKTGESWRMTFKKNKGYYWESINHLNVEPIEK
jgi:hypothetical protein